MAAGFVAGYLIERIGRKYTLMIFSVPFVLGWGLLAGSVNVPMMLVARVITGKIYTTVVPKLIRIFSLNLSQL